MTARAMRGDRDACLAAGMDGYVSKPIAWEELEAALVEHTGGTGQAGLPAKAPAPPAGPVGANWDARKFLEKLGSDENLLREVTDIFLDETPKLVARLQEAVKAGNAELVETTAHTLKGELSYFGCSAANQARDLERMGRERNLEGAAALFASFLEAVTSLMNLVRKDVRGESAHAG